MILVRFLHCTVHGGNRPVELCVHIAEFTVAMFEGVKGVGVKIKNLIANVSTFCIEVIINYCTVCKTRNISFK